MAQNESETKHEFAPVSIRALAWLPAIHTSTFIHGQISSTTVFDHLGYSSGVSPTAAMFALAPACFAGL